MPALVELLEQATPQYALSFFSSSPQLLPPIDERLLRTRLSYAGQAVIDELMYGNQTGLKDQNGEGRGKSWNIDFNSILDEDWLINTPMGILGRETNSSIKVARHCDGDITEASSCDNDFQLYTCTSVQDCNERKAFCRVGCEEWKMQDSSNGCFQELGDVDPMRFSTPDGFACYNECCGGGASALSSQATIPQQCMPSPSTQTHEDEVPKRLCIGQSAEWYDKVYSTIASAEYYVDISSLTPATGRFEAAIRNALTFLHNAGRTVNVRVLYGNIPSLSIDYIRTSLMRDIGSETTVTLTVGTWDRVCIGKIRDDFRMIAGKTKGIHNFFWSIGKTAVGNGVSWNHAKIVASDGHRLISGGHNMWDTNYLESSPVIDLSTIVSGEVASFAHEYLNVQWGKLCSVRRWRYLAKILFQGMISRVSSSSGSMCPKQYVPKQEKNTPHGSVPTISVGRYGGLFEAPPLITRSQTSDRAFIAMMRSAKNKIRISQQDIGPPGGYEAKAGKHYSLKGTWARYGNNWALVEICGALLRNIDVEIVTSNVGESAGARGGYAWGWTPKDILQMAVYYLQNGDILQEPTLHNNLSKDEIATLVCNHLTVTTAQLRRGEASWRVEERCPAASFSDKESSCNSQEAKMFGLHSKFYMVDDVAFYIGSHNLYSDPLAEFGLIFDDEEAVKDMMKWFWEPFWEASMEKAPFRSGTQCTKALLSQSDN